MIISISQIALVVDDYEEALAFYCGKLGFLLIEDTQLETKRWVRIRAPGGGGSEILMSKAVNAEQRAVIGNQAGGRVFLFFETNNFEHDYQQLKSRGIEFIEGPIAQSYGRVAVFKDLYGNRIDLIEPS